MYDIVINYFTYNLSQGGHMSFISSFFSGVASGYMGGSESIAELAGVDLTPSHEAQHAIAATQRMKTDCGDNFGRSVTHGDAMATTIPIPLEHLITPHPVVHTTYNPSNDMV
jgi:hypothetical protein